MQRTVAVLVCVFALLAVADAAEVDYARDVAPILQSRCAGCHGSGQQMAGLRVDTPDALLKGSHAGRVVERGNAKASKLVERVASTKKGFTMPPAGERLSDREISLLRDWIDSGAKYDAGAVNLSSAGTARSKHWAFQPIRRPQPPLVRTTAWVRSPIDAFILAKLEQENIAPSPEAAKRTLLRRVSLDLTGLPPTPSEVEDFVKDEQPGAYERVVYRLLKSPHYGEKWARQWLDLARYADSDGYEKDQVRPYAWRYRNWVINALNADMPFDQFTVEQIAGDLIPNATVEQRTATGFHRMVLTNREAGVDRAEARFEQDVNRTNTIGSVWLGLSVGCAQCHNHKYDPISQKEYYQLFAYVNKLEEADIDAPLAGEIGPYLQARPKYEAARAAILKEHKVLAYQEQWEQKMRQAIDNPGEDIEWDFMVTSFKAMVDNAVKLIKTEPAKRGLYQQEQLTDYFLRSIGPEFNRRADIRTCLADARTEVANITADLTPLTQAMTVVENSTAPSAYIALGGDYKGKGPTVDPGVLAVLTEKPVDLPDRLQFARWLVSRDNPLTARVAVNRMWQEFFGRGLVRTSDDFGTQGDKPTHPELLDWLASEFIESGWSTKAMHRKIVLSAAYRQSSNVRKDVLSRDPDNSLVSRQIRLRLPAELVRDAALSTGGILNDGIGGRSIRPPQPAGIAELGYGNSVKWVETKGPERYRRGLYVHYQRTTPYPQLTNFDAPGASVSCSRRARSNTPLQALNLLNDTVFLEAAQGLALRVLKESTSPANRIDYAVQLALARHPTQMERERLGSYLDQQMSIARKQPSTALMLPMKVEGIDSTEAAAWVGLSRVLLNLDEFITRE